MTKNDVIRELATMVTTHHRDTKEKGIGLELGYYWLTPSLCDELANIIEEVNNEDYGEGNWDLDEPAVIILRNHSYQNKSDF